MYVYPYFQYHIIKYPAVYILYDKANQTKKTRREKKTNEK